MNDARGRMKDTKTLRGSLMTSFRSSFAFILHVPVLALLFIMIASAARGQYTGSNRRDEADLAGGEVIALNFEGNHQISSDELSTVTATSVTGGFSRMFYYFPYSLLRFLGDPYQTLEFPTLQRDTQSINNYYRDRGLKIGRASCRERV